MNLPRKGFPLPLLVLGFTVFVLFFLVSWSFRSGNFRDPFRLERIVVCQDLDDNLQPMKISDRFPHDTLQVCFWLKYFSAYEGDELRVRWFFSTTQIHHDFFRLSSAEEDFKAFYLVREEGDALPVGEYRVEVAHNQKIVGQVEFSISPE